MLEAEDRNDLAASGQDQGIVTLSRHLMLRVLRITLTLRNQQVYIFVWSLLNYILRNTY